MNDKETMIDKLYDSIVYNDFDAIKKLVEDGVDIHQNNDNAFLIACFFGNVEIIDYFLNKGVDINASSVKDNRIDKYTLFGNGLSLAIDNNQWEAFEYLLKKKIKVDLDDCLALEKIIFKKEFVRAQVLMEKGADINQTNSLVNAIMQNQWSIAKFIINETNADIHVKDDLALRMFCNNGKFEFIKLLVEKGANINSVPVAEKNGFNDTALTYSIKKYSPEIFNYLIDNGADPNINNQEPFKNACELLSKNPSVKNCIDYYIEKKHVLFNDSIFKVLTKTKNLDLLELFLSDYPNKDIDDKNLLQNKAIYHFNNVEFFEYFLNKGYEIKDSTRNMLKKQKKDNFLQVLLNYDLRKDLPNQNVVTKKVKI